MPFSFPFVNWVSCLLLAQFVAFSFLFFLQGAIVFLHTFSSPLSFFLPFCPGEWFLPPLTGLDGKTVPLDLRGTPDPVFFCSPSPFSTDFA